ncbi:MAG: flagellar biosynthetic protein FliO [bacterium]|nr:flagellar biosynthetic protein FliO [bacterium]
MTTKNNRKRMLVTVGLIFVAAIAGLVMIGNDNVEASGSGETVQATGVASAFLPILKMLSALVVVVIAIYVGVWLLKRTMGRKFSGNQVYNSLEVLETTFVAPKKSVSLVRVADRSVLIGVTDQNISVLAELDSESTAQILAKECEQPETSSFADMLKSTVKKIQESAKRPQESVA